LGISRNLLGKHNRRKQCYSCAGADGEVDLNTDGASKFNVPVHRCSSQPGYADPKAGGVRIRDAGRVHRATLATRCDTGPNYGIQLGAIAAVNLIDAVVRCAAKGIPA
jgi:hypothetical protein